MEGLVEATQIISIIVFLGTTIGFFIKIGAFFKKLFKKKPKDGEEEPAKEPDDNNGVAMKDVEFSEEIMETITEDAKKEEEE